MINITLIFFKYQISNFQYNFKIIPKTAFWRFGIRLYKSQEDVFDDSSRHSDKNFPVIHFGVGHPHENWEWRTPNRIQFVQYHLQEHLPEFNTQESYVQLGEVEWDLDYNQDQSLFIARCTAAGCNPFLQEIKIPNEYKYFKVFAWADKIAFKLSCNFNIVDLSPHQSASNQNTPSFTLNNITFRLGDLFDYKILNNSDVIVLPTSSNGSMQPTVRSKINEFNIPPPRRRPAGAIEVNTINNGKKIVWAYSVEGSKGSTKNIIEAICNNIVTEFSNTNKTTISLPLLGTGAGSLSPVEIADIYNQLLNKKSNNLIFIISVFTNENFEKIESYFKNNETTDEKIKPFTKAQIYFRGRNEIEGVLGVKDIAAEVSELLNHMPAEPGAMLGIFGKWGRGKTFLINEIWDILGKEPNKKRVDFHAWKYQDTPAVWAYLYEQFATTFYSSARYKWHSFWRRIHLNFARLGMGEIIWFVFSFSISIYIAFGISITEKLNILQKILGSITLGAMLNILIIYFRFGKTAKSLFNKYYTRISFAKLLGIQAEVQKELKCLLGVWKKYIKNDRVYLFVEDIDRCSEEVIIKIIDSLRVMVDDEEISKRIVVVVAIDESILKRAINAKYRELVINESSILSNLVNEYIDKLFIASIKLGDLSDEERDDFFIELTKNDRITKDIPAFKRKFLPVKENNPLPIDHNQTELQKQRAEIETTQESNQEKIDQSQYDRISKLLRFRNWKLLRPFQKLGKDESESLNATYKLSDDEVKILRSCLEKHKTISPRQIKIFYYRYLMAKNLLIRYYLKLGRTNIWLIPTNSSIFINLLISYSQHEDPSTITTHKLMILKETNPEIKVYLLENVTINTLDYQELLKVLDLVIAY